MNQESTSHDSRGGEAELPLWKVFFYALGNAAGLLTYNTFNAYVQFFYTDKVGLPAHWVGRGWFAFGFWNAINDPISGWLSDNTQSRRGRRTFYIRLLAIPVAVAFALVWLPPLDVKQDGNVAVMAYFLIIISIYDILQSIITLNQDALFPEMFHEARARARGATMRQLVGFGVGGGVAIAVSPFIFDSSLGWTGLAILWGSLATLYYFLSLIGIEENPAYGERAQAEHGSSWGQFRIVLGNRIFWSVLVVNFVFRFILGALGAALPFYAKYTLELDEADTGILASAFIVTATVSLLGWQYIFDRWGTRFTVMLSFGLAALFAFPIFFTTALTTTLLALVGLGLMVGGIFLGPDLMFAEMIDEDFVRTGIRREGVYRGVLGFIYRFPPAFAGLVIGELLTGAGYNSDLPVSQQPEAVGEVVRIFTATGPLMAMVLGVLVMYFYPLYGERLSQIRQQAITRRADYH